MKLTPSICVVVWAVLHVMPQSALPVTAKGLVPQESQRGGPESGRIASRIARVEGGLPTIRLEGKSPMGLSLQQWMRALDIPGLSIAIIDSYRVVWAKGYGVKNVSTGDVVTENTLFQAASISKPVTALAVLHEVENGVFDLDHDINDYLQSWKLPGDEVAAGEVVTLRRLLAHSAGITPGGFQGYKRSAETPDLTQILDGKPPATNRPARIVATPGTGVAYSGLGYTIIQLALIDRLDRSFPDIMSDIVLEPLGLSASTFEQNLPDGFAARAASGHLVSGEVTEGGWRVYPEMAAAGLWTTPADLAVIAIEVARSKTGVSNRILGVETTVLMLEREQEHMGLGFVIGSEGGGRFSHSGGNEGFRCHMRFFAETGKGIVIMTNSDNGAHLFQPLMASVAGEYNWTSFEAQELPEHVALEIFEKIEGSSVVVDPAILADYVGKYELAPEFVFDVALEDGQLQIKLGDQPRFPVYPESETKFYYKVVDAQVSFIRDETGTVSALILHQHGQEQLAARIE